LIWSSIKRTTFALLGLAALAWAAEADTLRVMTFNVRYPAKGDGVNVWEQRRDLLIETVRKNAPDLVGTQELFHLQGQYIVEKLPEYGWFGLSRRGNQEDEHMGVFYRKDRLELAESGNYWLSEKPEEPGSMSWNVTLPRMVTWGVFRDRRNGRRFQFFNTHFAHRREDSDARTQSARVIAERLRKLPAGADLILTGDFNTDAGSEPHRILTELLKDAHASVAEPKGPADTFHGFSGKPRPGRIDWILYRGKLKTLSVETITENRDGRYPSDHFPVLAVFEWE
jgi:endonuclease/exonuclease/phosphatase family metal-dependent hydrolase